MSKKIISSEDSDLFRQSVGKVQPVTSDVWVLRSGRKPKPVPKSQQQQTSEINQAQWDIVCENLTAEDTLSFLAPGLQKKVLKKLAQGYFGADAQLDLHGLTRAEAKQQLWRFLYLCVKDGCRCVHIIHGKGYRSENNYPILKNHLNLWLRQHNEVQAFCSTHPKDGGAGAVLVLLHLAEKYKD